MHQCRVACTLLSAGGTQRSTQFGRPTLPFLSHPAGLAALFTSLCLLILTRDGDVVEMPARLCVHNVGDHVQKQQVLAKNYVVIHHYKNIHHGT